MGDEPSGPERSPQAPLPPNKPVSVWTVLAITLLTPLAVVWALRWIKPASDVPNTPPPSAAPPVFQNPLTDTTPVPVPPPVDPSGLRQNMFAFELAVFHVERTPPGAKDALVKTLASVPLSVGFPMAATYTDAPSVFIQTLPEQRFDVPLPKPLRFAPPEPSELETKPLLNPRAATKMRFDGPTKEAAKVYRAALAATQKHEATAPGAIWDETTKQMFVRKTWAARLEGWTGEIPDVASHVLVEATKDRDGKARVTTRGMAKLGLPDIVVNDIDGWQLDRMKSLVLLVAQTLVEGGTAREGSTLEVEIVKLRNEAARARHSRALLPGAKRTTLTIGSARALPTDAINYFVEIVFPGSTGLLPIRRQMVLDEALGSDDPVRVVQPAASAAD